MNIGGKKMEILLLGLMITATFVASAYFSFSPQKVSTYIRIPAIGFYVMYHAAFIAFAAAVFIKTYF
jgi:hypothetical protein